MARGKRMSAKVQQTVDRLLNGVREPQYTALTSDTIGLMQGLNYYANHAKQEQSKQWAVAWAQKNMPEIYKGLKNQKDWKFSNRGFVLRMVENGFVLSEEQLTKIKAELTKLSKIVEVEEEKKKPAVKKPAVYFNEVLEEFDYAVDDVLEGKEPRAIIFGSDKKKHAEVVDACNVMLQSMEDNPEYFKKETLRPMKKFLGEVKKNLEVVVKAVKQERVSKVAPKKINPVKMVSKMPYKKEDLELALKSVRPDALIGAKQAIVFCAKYRFLMYFKAASDEGFMASGATLKNFDLEKSILKKVRKPEEMAAAIKDMTLAGMKKYLESVKSTEYPARGRFNEEMLILKVSG